MEHALNQRSYFHAGGPTPLLGDTVDGHFREVASRHRDREAIVSVAQGRRLTYGELDREVEQAARGLLALNVCRGDRVGIWSTDNIEWVVLQLATARVGAVLVNVNPANRVAELRHALGLARVQEVFFIPSFRTSQYAAMLEELCPDSARLDTEAFAASSKPGLPDLRRLIVFDPDDPRNRVRPQPGMLTWPEFLERGRDVAAEQVAERQQSLDPDDPINIQFTSGTTGFPKAVVLTHHNILNNGYFIGEAMGFTEQDRLCVPVPFYHCFGMVVSTLACLTHGAALVIPAPHFEAGATLAAIETERCTALHGVPTTFIAELERPDFDRYDLSSLRTGIMAGAPCPPELMKRVIERMGCREILIGYGQTESSPVTHLTRPNDPFDKRIETVGTNLPHQEVKVVDPGSGAVQPIGVAGEVCFRGYHVMRGYFGQPEATRKTIDEAGWLHSGDIGVMDRDGYVRITARIKDMIIRGGEKIYPAEIEAFYFQHPKVAEIAVFGVPDPRFGEEVGAWIRLHHGQHADPQEFRDWSRGRIAHYKVPRYIWLVEEFPTTVTGKIQKFRIREIVAGWLRASPGNVAGEPAVRRD
jgi:fatty-acyl-CoA synthase